jgi:small subunit ribosomal protein S35
VRLQNSFQLLITVFAGEFRVDKTYKAQMFRRVSVLRPLSQRLCTPPAVPAGDAVLRFSYVGVIDPASLKTTHPAERKVTLEVRVADLPLTTDAQRERLLGLVGPRFNASKGVLKLTSERYPTMGENKAYLRSVLDELLAEARRT